MIFIPVPFKSFLPIYQHRCADQLLKASELCHQAAHRLSEMRTGILTGSWELWAKLPAAAFLAKYSQTTNLTIPRSA